MIRNERAEMVCHFLALYAAGTLILLLIGGAILLVDALIGGA